MKLGYTILYVEDVRRAVAFYNQAFGFDTRFVHESGDFAELATGTTTLAFSSRQLIRTLGKTPQAPDPEQPCFEIAVVTDDVQAALDRALAAGATLRQTPEEMPWGQTVAYVCDPEGFLVEICTPVST
ncbi:VOC family protein [Ectothiorhodospira lacustris]|uniref:VOC family protein n=1 Tax=Ectothiorhodospira lacustris TaxID=2899127 RepID=UPI001EE8F853|nr:VOC family protein [Ectothiorhodospira lacustris]MCG5499770.1 VOC family protein [Ectothiorhodospira lacustris]MCG5509773.1 VOC family protein [Ectothiorhodospira lacustris]MCG5522313.1 VOC family protein [Ectothiorhodospira lacustris]